MFTKKIAFPLLVTIVLVSLVSCGYSIWSYHAVERKLDNADSWSFSFSTGRGSGPRASKLSTDDTLKYSFDYAILFKEKDTTSYERLNFRVNNIRYRLSSKDEPIALKPLAEDSNPDEYVGATSVNHVIIFGPLLISMPLPDSITFEQDITVFYQDSNKEITTFHHVVKAVLREGKYSHFQDFIRGT